jgi:hypothetical protein
MWTHLILTQNLELDINLFEQEDLYDVNTVSSMFKAWLRQLPEQVFPQEIQNRVIQKCSKVEPQPTSTPQYLKDEISQLPPWNYYLLFAITCHISLLHNCSKDNKMTYGNLCVCFAPCLKIEQWIFQWLVLDWKNCWQGCSTEREYLEKEYVILEEAKQKSGNADGPVQTVPKSKPASTPKANDRAVEEATRSASSTGHYGSTTSSSSTLVPSRDRPLQHFDKIPPPPAASRDQQQGHQQRPSTAHATLAPNGHHDRNEQRSTDTDNSSNGRSTPPISLEQDFLQRFPRPVVANGTTNATNRNATSQSPSRPITGHIAHQQKSRDTSSDREMPARIDRGRANTNPAPSAPRINRESPTPKKERHRPPPMISRSTPTRSPELKGKSDVDGSEDGSSPESRSVGGGIGLTAPELSPLKPLSPIGGL